MAGMDGEGGMKDRGHFRNATITALTSLGKGAISLQISRLFFKKNKQGKKEAAHYKREK